MIAYLLLLYPWLACDSADLGRFPGCLVADEQLVRCAEHEARLRTLRGIHGWQGGWWDDALKDLDFARRYWLALSAAHDGWFMTEVGRRQRLVVLRDLIGPERYAAGWHPVLIPPASAFGPPLLRAAGR